MYIYTFAAADLAAEEARIVIAKKQTSGKRTSELRCLYITYLYLCVCACIYIHMYIYIIYVSVHMYIYIHI